MERTAKEIVGIAMAERQWTKSLIEAIYDGVLIADTLGNVCFVNAGYLKIVGLQETDIIGRPLLEVRPGSALPQVIKSGEARMGVYRREGNAEYVVDMSPIRFEEAIVGGISTVKEIARLQALSHELEKYVKKNRELTAVVSNIYKASYTFQDIRGSSQAIRKAVVFAQKIAQCDEDVLICGESGTGKEMFAQAIHNASSRSTMPFVPVNCPTLSSTLAESELFGYEPGAFTGARKGGKVGLFFVADNGTIMLDEIAELPYEMQAKLLRVLQERKVRRIGEAAEQAINIRVIAVTNKNLLALSKEGKFREDLYYRLNAMTLEVPSLKSRRDDLALLAEHFLAEWCKRNGRYLTLHESAWEMINSYDWPGNIRELKHVIEFSAYLCEGSVIHSILLPQSTPQLAALQGKEIPLQQESLKRIVENTERAVIRKMLKQYGDSLESKKRIAGQLGISLATLYNKAKYLLEEEKP
jgi:transcriptional regulator with PAS, ATPase and Fis domain